MKMTADQLQKMEELLHIRVQQYDFLRQALLAEPTEEWLYLLRKSGYFNDVPFADEEPFLKRGADLITNTLAAHPDEDKRLFNQLHWDFTRLFIGPFQLPAPPWASAYKSEERMLFQEEAVQVRKAYSKYGYASSRYQAGDESTGRPSREPEDHIGYELDFMYRLAVRAKDAWKRNEKSEFAELIRDQSFFLHQHLLTWSAAFAGDLREQAATEFYQGLADVLEQTLHLDEMLLADAKAAAAHLSSTNPKEGEHV
ncbi:TorD/DmsD family molecular chaperone [Salisediminibacterium halotolerans]|uniref:TorD/DmsD family molecular chaperone n=1 Tax=Salisediminibacterium halotolerans TaxID=517425 RepID=UPI000EB493B1|nr:molecular chaperone TorD family protein [Salisediminibacterium halotolerans]RLJ75735.1 Tat proofreading chaperone TorD [Actinophytocola xinjiangensis]RPE89589.1 Tat proofreading chaperone TorD [Salisediminibacterium halotolerans]TWG36348.1 Tat proofreading chaperone TorD [Salisediminibacterium halotolerans]GEL09202.1 dehydrogenase [Salisediminibacterium halotolerans]